MSGTRAKVDSKLQDPAVLPDSPDRRLSVPLRPDLEEAKNMLVEAVGKNQIDLATVLRALKDANAPLAV